MLNKLLVLLAVIPFYGNVYGQQTKISVGNTLYRLTGANALGDSIRLTDLSG